MPLAAQDLVRFSEVAITQLISLDKLAVPSADNDDDITFGAWFARLAYIGLNYTLQKSLSSSHSQGAVSPPKHRRSKFSRCLRSGLQDRVDNLLNIPSNYFPLTANYGAERESYISSKGDHLTGST